MEIILLMYNNIGNLQGNISYENGYSFSILKKK